VPETTGLDEERARELRVLLLDESGTDPSALLLPQMQHWRSRR
jgi:hypothetical protein